MKIKVKSEGSFILSIIIFLIFNFLAIQNFYTSITITFLILLMFLCSLNSYLTILILVCSQILAPPPGFPLTLTQIFILIWIITNLYELRSLKIFYIYVLKYFIPYFIVVVLISFVNLSINRIVDSISLIIVFFIIYASLKHIKSQIPLAINIIIGAFCGAMPFLLKNLNLIYFSDERHTLISGAMRGGLERFSAGLGDFNYIGACMLVTLIGALALFMFSGNNLSMLKKVFILLIGIATIPSILATLSRSAIIGIFISIGIVLAIAISNHTLKQKSGILLLTFLGIFILVFYYVQEDLITKYINALHDFSINSRPNEYTRSNVFLIHIKNIINNPLLGNKVFINGVEFGAHNVFLQVGSDNGLIGLATYTYVILWVPYKKCKAFSNNDNLPFIAMYFICLYSMFWLSIGGWKIFWILWVILISKSCNYTDSETIEKRWRELEY